jgi:hypothetical protein
MAKDDTGNNAAKGSSNKITNPGTAGINSWFWMALIIIVAIVLAAALLGRARARDSIDPTDPALRVTRDENDIRDIRDQKSRDRRDDQLRKAG